MNVEIYPTVSPRDIRRENNNLPICHIYGIIRKNGKVGLAVENVMFLKEPGYINDLFFLFLLYFNSEYCLANMVNGYRVLP